MRLSDCRPAEIYSSNHFDYTVNQSGSAMIVGYTGKDTHIEIPTKIDGHDVKKIGAGAFTRTPNGIVAVNIPSSVTLIGMRAFSGCTQLEQVNIPSSVKFICDKAFYGCKSIEYIAARGVKDIGKEAFRGCTALKKIELSNLSSIGGSAFIDCKKMKDITFIGNREDFESICVERGNKPFLAAYVRYAEADKPFYPVTKESREHAQAAVSLQKSSIAHGKKKEIHI